MIIGENSSSGPWCLPTSYRRPRSTDSQRSGDASGSSITLSKSRNTTYGSFTKKLNDDDIIGSITFRGDDGTDYNSTAALIKAEVDADTGSNDMEALVFATTSDGAASPTEALRVDSAWIVSVNNPNAIYSSSDNFVVHDTDVGLELVFSGKTVVR